MLQVVDAIASRSTSGDLEHSWLPTPPFHASAAATGGQVAPGDEHAREVVQRHLDTGAIAVPAHHRRRGGGGGSGLGMDNLFEVGLCEGDLSR